MQGGIDETIISLFFHLKNEKSKNEKSYHKNDGWDVGLDYMVSYLSSQM